MKLRLRTNWTGTSGHRAAQTSLFEHLVKYGGLANVEGVASVSVCAQCDERADRDARDWLAYLVDLPDEDEEPEVIFFCPRCTAAELGRKPRPLRRIRRRE